MTPEPRGANDSVEKASDYGGYDPQRHQQYMPKPGYGTDQQHDPYRFQGSAY